MTGIEGIQILTQFIIYIPAVIGFAYFICIKEQEGNIMRHEWMGRYNRYEWCILQSVAWSGYGIIVDGKANHTIHYGSYGEALQAIIQYVNGR